MCIYVIWQVDSYMYVNWKNQDSLDMTIKEKHSGKICSAICQFKVTVLKTKGY